MIGDVSAVGTLRRMQPQGRGYIRGTEEPVWSVWGGRARGEKAPFPFPNYDLWLKRSPGAAGLPGSLRPGEDLGYRISLFLFLCQMISSLKPLTVEKRLCFLIASPFL